MRPLFLAFFMFFFGSLGAIHYPIQFAIPKQKVLDHVPEKSRDFAFINPYDKSTYIYDSETNYYQDYQRSYFGVTSRKAGWDCLRHYEILANGCIPYFVDLDQCPPQTMALLPKDLIWEAMHLPGVNYETLSIDHTIFDHQRYKDIVHQLLEYTREHLTTEQLAAYLLHKVGYTGEKPVLFLSRELWPDYMRCLTLIGLKQFLGGDRVIDSPRIDHIYTDYAQDPKNLYGKGLTYTKVIPPDSAKRTHLEKRIRQREFGLIIYGSVHRGLPLHDIVTSYYSPQEIVYICGEDHHDCIAVPPSMQFFLREFDCLKTSKN